MMCISGTPKGMEASLSASFWISCWKAALSPFRNGAMRLFRIFSKTSTLFCTGQARKGPQQLATGVQFSCTKQKQGSTGYHKGHNTDSKSPHKCLL